jgi:hypothetical protein
MAKREGMNACRSTAVVLVLAALLPACAGDAPVPTPTPPAVAVPAGTPEPAPSALIPEAQPVPVADEDIGVPECDGFARRYLACLERVPEASRPAVRSSFDRLREHWKRVATDAKRKAGLAEACKKNEELTKKGMERYGCAW